ncbi:ATP-binding protein [Nocardioides sp. C4-1]|uniref:ATP-binding protein n=1 Tax=Nocardioides sp. C4-1 TaxID=3151851 RepID=UPI003263A7E5
MNSPSTNPFEVADSGDSNPRASLIEVDRALESMRDSGFDLTAAIGEPIDNSIEASASIIRIVPEFSSDKKHIRTIVFADNGRGIGPDILPSILKMGYSTRYGQREGLGRFGVGLKLAALSLGTRIEVITKPAGTDGYFRAYLDLEKIKDRSQQYIEAETFDGWPAQYADLMRDEKGKAFESGTLVLWQHIDRLSNGGTYGSSLDSRVSEMRKFIARAYREYLDKGLNIHLGDTAVNLHDPLFLRDNPRLLKRYKHLPEETLRGRIVDEGDIKIDDQTVHVTVTLIPEFFRPFSGAGGETDAEGKNATEFNIPDNEGRISMLRNGREIYYDIIPRMLGKVERIDRYIGIEVSFPATLDEYFQVRHVKRGAEPVDKLRTELRTWLERPIKTARTEIRRYWRATEVKNQTVDGHNQKVMQAVQAAERTAPKGQAGLGVSPEKQAEVIQDLLEDLEIDVVAEPEKAELVREQVEKWPISLMDTAWPGKEMVDITHLNGKAVVRINHRHPFIRDVYDPLRAASSKLPEDQERGEMFDLIQRTSNALDMLLMAYAKAENLHSDPSIYDDLRSYWGQHLQAYMKELGKE